MDGWPASQPASPGKNLLVHLIALSNRLFEFLLLASCSWTTETDKRRVVIRLGGRGGDRELIYSCTTRVIG